MQEEWRNYEKYKCFYKGRMIARAADRIEEFVKDMNAEANRWTDQNWGGRAQMRFEAVGAVKMISSVARRKTRYLSELPYLFSRITMPGVAAQCLAEWERGKPEDHHPLAVLLMTPGSAEREAIEQIPPEGIDEGNLPKVPKWRSG